MPPRALLFGIAATFACAADSARAATICTIVADARSGEVLIADGDCDTRVTPASTFKIALAVMGYDFGFLQDMASPRLSFQKGDPDWLGEVWRHDTDPARWLKYSVVWYSQRITHALGADKLSSYARHLGYGNADFSGDPSKENGLQRSWIGSSLKISPREQVAFVTRLLNGNLPVSPVAMEMTVSIVEQFHSEGGWRVHGKTGSAFPRKPDGTLDRARGWGWFVGWADKANQRLVFARLQQDEQHHAEPGGLRARASLIGDWPALAASVTQGE